MSFYTSYTAGTSPTGSFPFPLRVVLDTEYPGMALFCNRCDRVDDEVMFYDILDFEYKFLPKTFLLLCSHCGDQVDDDGWIHEIGEEEKMWLQWEDRILRRSPL